MMVGQFGLQNCCYVYVVGLQNVCQFCVFFVHSIYIDLLNFEVLFVVLC